MVQSECWWYYIVDVDINCIDYYYIGVEWTSSCILKTTKIEQYYSSISSIGVLSIGFELEI